MNDPEFTPERIKALLGISLSTLTKWENNLRRPSGAAAKLLDILKKHPERIDA